MTPHRRAGVALVVVCLALAGLVASVLASCSSTGAGVDQVPGYLGASTTGEGPSPDDTGVAMFVLAQEWGSAIGQAYDVRRVLDTAAVEWVDELPALEDGRTCTGLYNPRDASMQVVARARVSDTALLDELPHALLAALSWQHDPDATHAAPPGPWTDDVDLVIARARVRLQAMGL